MRDKQALAEVLEQFKDAMEKLMLEGQADEPLEAKDAMEMAEGEAPMGEMAEEVGPEMAEEMAEDKYPDMDEDFEAYKRAEMRGDRYKKPFGKVKSMTAVMSVPTNKMPPKKSKYA